MAADPEVGASVKPDDDDENLQALRVHRLHESLADTRAALERAQALEDAILTDINGSPTRLKSLPLEELRRAAQEGQLPVKAALHDREDWQYGRLGGDPSVIAFRHNVDCDLHRETVAERFHRVTSLTDDAEVLAYEAELAKDLALMGSPPRTDPGRCRSWMKQ
eukprot:gnl/MRDRNA2_/MRDRNA2_157257_c0_seq1.p1 gnl/MRDRNA2_/MRDRNA2_157257_c0~~gnl/MRDRNA2_/MRDRNA2_157257_c0_seq1.p1  ORF type:complete len:164 (-),score=37.44 gnl/MRDRNA2_/MRDRNA2_157257_c0_seq1:42-533(-)